MKNSEENIVAQIPARIQNQHWWISFYLMLALFFAGSIMDGYELIESSYSNRIGMWIFVPFGVIVFGLTLFLNRWIKRIEILPEPLIYSKTERRMRIRVTTVVTTNLDDVPTYRQINYKEVYGPHPLITSNFSYNIDDFSEIPFEPGKIYDVSYIRNISLVPKVE